MTQETKLLKILLSITAISNDNTLAFHEKLEKILEEIVACMQAKRGSIMLLKGRKSLEVAASTNPELVGFKQSLDGQSPSGWVVKNKTPLYVDSKTGHEIFGKKVEAYEKSAFLVVPVMANDKVMGVLNVTDKIGEDLFEKGEQEILLEVAGTVIGALETQRLSQSLKKSKSTLAKKNKRLKKLEKLRTDLFNMLIHDLKGPISEVVANLDILSYTTNEENLPFVESAQIGCDTLQSMVSNLLDIARFEERRLELIVERINPEDLIHEALDRLIRVGQMKAIEFTEAFPPAQDREAFSGDRSLLLRVLQNLLGNAMQYSPPGEKIKVGFEYLKTSKIRFFVKDSGPGVPPKHQKAIFEKFTQLDKKTDGRIYTTGLGLAFCKMAVQAHGGKIGVKSEVPAGSCFWFVVPSNPK
jgi:two-component system sensor histidine kinase KdpD